MGVINSVRIEFQRPHGNSDDAVVAIQTTTVHVTVRIFLSATSSSVVRRSASAFCVVVVVVVRSTCVKKRDA